MRRDLFQRIIYSRTDDLLFLDSNEETYTVQTNPARFTATSRPARTTADDRPITPMRGTYRQIAAKFVDDDGLPTDPSLTNQYYEAYNDFEQDDHSPTRDRREKEFHDQVCQSFNGSTSTSNNERAMSASQRSTTMNSLSRTIDPRHPAPVQSNPVRQSKYLTSSRTVASARQRRSQAISNLDEHNVTLRDNPTHDAFGPLAKSKKIASLQE